MSWSNVYLFFPHFKRICNDVYLLQKRKEVVPLVTPVPPATPVPALPSSTETSQAAVFPVVREPPPFKAREDLEPIPTVTTVEQIFFS